MGPAQVVAVSIPERLLDRLDEKVRKQKASRSSAVCCAILDWLGPQSDAASS